MMKIMIVVVLLVIGLASFTGCIMIPYGNYAAISDERNQQLAKATLIQLVKLYPPAKTRFNLCQPITDSYGATLVRAMRDQGYALVEYSSQSKTKEVPGLNFCYVVDAVSSTNLYRVTLTIGKKSISHAFTFTSDDKLYPIGRWIFKE